jgi:CheY-like chemotaxis protein
LITLVARSRISGGGFIVFHKQRIIDLDIKSRIPAIYTTAQTLMEAQAQTLAKAQAQTLAKALAQALAEALAQALAEAFANGTGRG